MTGMYFVKRENQYGQYTLRALYCPAAASAEIRSASRSRLAGVKLAQFETWTDGSSWYKSEKEA